MKPPKPIPNDSRHLYHIARADKPLSFRFAARAPIEPSRLFKMLAQKTTSVQSASELDLPKLGQPPP